MDRPTPIRRLDYAELREGDVVFSFHDDRGGRSVWTFLRDLIGFLLGRTSWLALLRGAVPVSWLIAHLDHGPYSHVAYYLGRDDDGGHTIVECGPKGVYPTSLEASVEENAWVDVYRFRSDPDADDERHELGDPGWPPDPVSGVALGYTNERREGREIRYSYVQALLVALLARYKGGDVDPATERWIVAAFREAEAVLNRWLEEGHEAMVCSELVYRCFLEADPAPPWRYGLWVPGSLAEPAAGAPGVAPPEWAGPELRRRMEAFDALWERARARPDALGAGNPTVEEKLVTPRNLAESRNLSYLGTLPKA